MTTVDLIERKRDGETLSTAEISWLGSEMLQLAGFARSDEGGPPAAPSRSAFGCRHAEVRGGHRSAGRGPAGPGPPRFAPQSPLSGRIARPPQRLRHRVRRAECGDRGHALGSRERTKRRQDRPCGRDHHRRQARRTCRRGSAARSDFVQRRRTFGDGSTTAKTSIPYRYDPGGSTVADSWEGSIVTYRQISIGIGVIAAATNEEDWHGFQLPSAH